MNKIHELPPSVVSKIAAGEVIERPSFAVKELIENAIDAGATEIKVFLEDAGLTKILVIDNGEGMSAGDVLASWKAHTTSKITSEDELHSIKSLGFRGEALSSLAAVSTLTIKSRSNDSPTGYSVTISEGKLEHSSEVGMPVGTAVLVEHLFSHLPVRRKFLKSGQTELRYSIDVLHTFAFVNPSIRFTLIHGKKTLIDYPATSLQDRIEQIVGSEAYAFFIPVKKQESYVLLNGYIAKPQNRSSTQNKQYLFVNTRSVIDKSISLAVKEAYGTMLESTIYPVFILFITLPFEMVDVNVHPRKEQVQFVNNQYVFQTIKQLVGQVLNENNLTFMPELWKRRGVGLTKSFAGRTLKKNVLDKEQFTDKQQTKFLQYHNLYIIVATKNDLMLVDQHAAHERILFEKLKEEFLLQKRKNISQSLPKPVAIKLSPGEKLLFDEHIDLLKQIGFRFHNDTITHVPFLFQDRDPKECIMQILEDNHNIHSVDRDSEEMLAFLACRAAVKAGDKLTEEQMRKILEELETAPNNATCPHGRPTKFIIPFEQLNSMFNRT